jgi:hypothetical protein
MRYMKLALSHVVSTPGALQEQPRLPPERCLTNYATKSCDGRIGVTERERAVLTLFGAAVVTCMMLFYALEGRSPWFTFAFAVACLGSSTYGWLAGTWPFGIVEAVWALIAFRKWVHLRTTMALPARSEESPGS